MYSGAPSECYFTTCSPLQESEAFDMMLGRLLNAGFVSQARELAALFEHDSPDLTIVLVGCLLVKLHF